MSKFNIGDTYEVIANSCYHDAPIGAVIKVIGLRDEHSFNYKEGWMITEKDVRQITTAKITIMTSMKSFLKSLTRQEPEKSFVQVGFLDDAENVTEKGREALEYVLWDANKDALKTLADKIIADEDEKKK